MRNIISLLLCACILVAVQLNASGFRQLGACCADDDDAALEEIEVLAKTVWGEGRGLSEYEKTLIICCVLNRVDDPQFDDTIKAVCEAPGQFHGCLKSNPIDPETYNLCLSVCTAWVNGEELPLPPEFVFFYGDGAHNYFYDRQHNYFTKSY